MSSAADKAPCGLSFFQVKGVREPQGNRAPSQRRRPQCKRPARALRAGAYRLDARPRSAQPADPRSVTRATTPAATMVASTPPQWADGRRRLISAEPFDASLPQYADELTFTGDR